MCVVHIQPSWVQARFGSLVLERLLPLIAPSVLARPGNEARATALAQMERANASRRDTMLKRVAAVLWMLALMSGWAAGPGSPSADGGPKAVVGVFKDDAVAVIDTAQKKGLVTIAVPQGPPGLLATPNGRKVYVSSDGAST